VLTLRPAIGGLTESVFHSQPLRLRQRVPDGVKVEPAALQKGTAACRFLAGLGLARAKTTLQNVSGEGIPVDFASVQCSFDRVAGNAVLVQLGPDPHRAVA